MQHIFKSSSLNCTITNHWKNFLYQLFVWVFDKLLLLGTECWNLLLENTYTFILTDSNADPGWAVLPAPLWHREQVRRDVPQCHHLTGKYQALFGMWNWPSLYTHFQKFQIPSFAWELKCDNGVFFQMDEIVQQNIEGNEIVSLLKWVGSYT